MRIPSGKTDQYIFFVAVDATDLKTRETGLSGFTVYRSRNGGTATAYTTPTVAELSAANMPGVYALLIDEDTTIASGSDSEEYVVHITQASMAPVTRAIEIYRRDTTSGRTLAVDSNNRADASVGAYQSGQVPLQPTTAGRTLDVTAGGEAGIDWANIGSPSTAQNLSGTTVKTATDVETDTQDIQSRLPAALGANGNIKADVRDFSGTAGIFSGGRPEVNTTHIGGTAQTAGDLPARLTAARAGYLDNLHVGGNVASSAEVTGLNVNTRCNLLVPIEIETPDASTQVFKIRLHLYDPLGDMEDPDSTPTIALTNAAGTDLSSRLSAASTLSKGVYTWDYTATAGDAEEQLVWLFTVVEGGVTRTYPATSYVVEQSAYRFTSSDRSNLNAIKTKTDNLPVDPADASDIAASFATVNTKLDTIDDFIDTEIGAIKAKTDNLPALPAAVSDIPTANQNADALLKRDWTAVTGESARSVLNALRFLRNKWSVVAGTLTVTKEDDTTAAWTGAVTTDAAADPITGNDPA